MPTPAAFSRASVAYKQDGTQVAASVPRYEAGQYGEAIMVEEETTNLIWYSDEFDNAYWAKSNVTVTPNATTAPDGTVTADKLVEDNVTSTFTLYRESLFTIGQPGSFSVDVWHGGRSECALFFDASNRAFFNIVNGTIGAVTGTGVTAQIKDLGNDRYRCSISKASIDASSVHAQIAPASGGSLNYAGDVTKGIYIWRAHAELKTFPTTPVKTSGGTATRADEILTIPPAGVFNSTEFTLEFGHEPGTQPIAGRYALLWDYRIDANNFLRLYEYQGRPFLECRSAGTTYMSYVGTEPVMALGEQYRFAIRATATAARLFLDGVPIGSAVTFVQPVGSPPAQMYLGKSSTGSTETPNGLYDDLRISNTTHSDEKIAADYALGTAKALEEDTTYLAPFDGSLVATSLSYFHRYLSLGDLRLDDCTALDHGPGLNLGTDEVQTRLISSGDIDGDEVAGSRYGNTEVFLPVNIGRQATWADVVARYEELRAELVKPSNLLRWGAEDSNDVLVYSIVEPASVPPLIGGRAPTPPDVRLFEGSIPVVLKRLPGPPIDIEAKP